MKNFNMSFIAIGVLSLLLFSCQPKPSSELKDALTFYVSFDNGTDADFALGDNNIYTAKASYENSSRVLEGIQTGMKNSDHSVAKGQGVFGDAFEFGQKTDTVLFYKSENNIAYNPKSWSGTISFWLRVDPINDLDGYTDPIQITDREYNDASLWVDFTDANPPDFRLGLIGDKDVWTKDTLNAPVMAVFEKRLVTLKKPPFSKNSWTHVLVTYDGLGTAKSLGTLYLNGKKIGEVNGINDPFTWVLEESKIFLGLNYSGLMDELSIFDKPFTDDQVKKLYHLEDGIKSIL